LLAGKQIKLHFVLGKANWFVYSISQHAPQTGITTAPPTAQPRRPMTGGEEDEGEETTEMETLLTKRFRTRGEATERIRIEEKFTVDLTPYVPVTEDDGDYWDGEIALLEFTDGKGLFPIEVGRFRHSTRQEFIPPKGGAFYQFCCVRSDGGSASVRINLLDAPDDLSINERLFNNFLRMAAQARLTINEATFVVEQLRGRLLSMAYNNLVTFSEPEQPRQTEG